MTEIEIKAEVFRIIRANNHKSAKRLMADIKKHMPDVSRESIVKAITELKEQADD